MPRCGYTAAMHIAEEFMIRDLAEARAIVRRHPFATLVAADLRATHMPFILDEAEEGLVVLGHVALADPVADALDERVLAIFHGPHGYVSASWYAEGQIPTWNHITLHVRGTPERLPDALPVLRATVDHLEAPVERPWSLDSAGETARTMADKVVAIRLRADSWHAEAKLSQNQPAHERARVVAGLERPGPYANLSLAAAMRRRTKPRP